MYAKETAAVSQSTSQSCSPIRAVYAQSSPLMREAKAAIISFLADGVAAASAAISRGGDRHNASCRRNNAAALRRGLVLRRVQSSSTSPADPRCCGRCCDLHLPCSSCLKGRCTERWSSRLRPATEAPWRGTCRHGLASDRGGSVRCEAPPPRCRLGWPDFFCFKPISPPPPATYFVCSTPNAPIFAPSSTRR